MDVWVNANTTSRALPIISFFESGTFSIDKYEHLTCDKAFVNNHYYSDKAPLPTYAVLPFFGLLKCTGIIKADKEGNFYGRHIYLIGGFLIGSLPFTLLVMLLFFEIRKKQATISPVLLSMFPFYLSFLFVFAGTYFAHLFAGLLLLLSYIKLKRRQYFIAGVLSGFAFLSEYNLAVLIFMWGIIILVKEKRFKPFFWFSTGILPSLIFILIYNYWFTGSLFQFLYMYHNFSELSHNYGFILPGFESLFGLSFGWYRGMFWFAPFLALIAGTALIKIIKGKKYAWITNYLVLPGMVYYIFIASYFAWWGGWTYGPRLLSGLIILLIYEGLIFITNQKITPIAFWITSALGFIWIFGARLTIAYSAPTGAYNPLASLVWPKIKSGQFSENNLLSIFFNVSPTLAAGLFISIFIFGSIVFTYAYKKWKNV